MKVIFLTDKDKRDPCSYNIVNSDFNYKISMKDLYQADIVIVINKDKTGYYKKNRFGDPNKILSQEDIMGLILKYT